MSDKVIGSFQQRRQLLQAFEALGETRTEAELTAGARELVHSFPQALILSELLKRLDTPSSQLRGGLGYVAALLPPDEVVPALRKALADRRNQPQIRITASLLLERFLGQSPPQALISDLEDSNEVAFQSLREAVEESAENRHILLEYVTQMRETETAVAFMIIEMLTRLEPVQRIELLRLIAQDDRPDVARAALAALEDLAGDKSAAGGVVRALHVLQFSLEPASAAIAERSLRKLRFAGTVYRAPESEMPGWGALLSPADPGGNQTVWLVNYATDDEPFAAVIGAIVNPRAGIIQLSADETVLPGFIMPRHAVGELVPVSTGGDAPTVMLQVPFDYGRWLIRQAQEVHWRGTALTPYPNELKLYGDLIWQFAGPMIEPEVLALWTTASPSDHAEESRRTVELLDAAEALTANPAMERWIHGNPLLLNLVELAAQQPAALPPDLIARRLLQVLAEWPGHTQMLDAFEIGLRGQAAWFHYRGDAENSDRALALAAIMAETPITQNPLLVTMLSHAMADAEHDA